MRCRALHHGLARQPNGRISPAMRRVAPDVCASTSRSRATRRRSSQPFRDYCARRWPPPIMSRGFGCRGNDWIVMRPFASASRRRDAVSSQRRMRVAGRRPILVTCWAIARNLQGLRQATKVIVCRYARSFRMRRLNHAVEGVRGQTFDTSMLPHGIPAGVMFMSMELKCACLCKPIAPTIAKATSSRSRLPVTTFADARR